MPSGKAGQVEPREDPLPRRGNLVSGVARSDAVAVIARLHLEPEDLAMFGKASSICDGKRLARCLNSAAALCGSDVILKHILYIRRNIETSVGRFSTAHAVVH